MFAQLHDTTRGEPSGQQPATPSHHEGRAGVVVISNDVAADDSFSISLPGLNDQPSSGLAT